MFTSDLLNALSRYDSRCKSCKIRRKLSVNKYIKKQNISENDLRKVTKLQSMSIADLRKIPKLRKLKNCDKMSKKDLIYTLLRSEKNISEDNYIKYISINIDDNDGIRTKINNINIVLARLGNIIAKKDRDKIRKELYDIDKRKDSQKLKKKGSINILLN